MPIPELFHNTPHGTAQTAVTVLTCHLPGRLRSRRRQRQALLITEHPAPSTHHMKGAHELCTKRKFEEQVFWSAPFIDMGSEAQRGKDTLSKSHAIITSWTSASPNGSKKKPCELSNYCLLSRVQAGSHSLPVECQAGTSLQPGCGILTAPPADCDLC